MMPKPFGEFSKKANGNNARTRPVVLIGTLGLLVVLSAAFIVYAVWRDGPHRTFQPAAMPAAMPAAIPAAMPAATATEVATEQPVLASPTETPKAEPIPEPAASPATQNDTPAEAKPSPAIANGRTAEMVKAAVEFAFDGIGFNATLDDVKQHWPNARLLQAESNPKLNLQVYRISKEAGGNLDISFLDGKIMMFNSEYSKSITAAGGGWRSLLLWKLWKQIGPEDPNSVRDDQAQLATKSWARGTGMEACYKWQIIEAHRFIELIAYNSGAAVLVVVNGPLFEKFQGKQSGAVDVGF
ncbi:MAG: hypothetical protein WCS42_25150 [Verrucomicrobiota bacterium]